MNKLFVQYEEIAIFRSFLGFFGELFSVLLLTYWDLCDTIHTSVKLECVKQGFPQMKTVGNKNRRDEICQYTGTVCGFDILQHTVGFRDTVRNREGSCRMVNSDFVGVARVRRFKK